MRSRKGQVWVETVIYTLIAFAVMGLVLSFVQPEIEKSKDKSTFDQSKRVLDLIDYEIEKIRDVPGNTRAPEISISKGTFIFDGVNDRITFEMESSYKYTEPGIEIFQDGLNITTVEKGDEYIVNMTKDYTQYNLTFENQLISEEIHPSSSGDTLIISNEGVDSEGKPQINLEVE